MSLDDHLSDVLGDVTNIEVETISLESHSKETTREPENDAVVTISLEDNFSKDLSNHFTKHYFKTLISGLEVVDYKLACEAMAGDPDNYLAIAKLTKAPSRINKEVLEVVLNNTPDVVDSDVANRVVEFRDVLENTKELRRTLGESLLFLSDKYKEQITRLNSNSPLVIYDGERVNLFEEDISTISMYDDHSYMYEKYAGTIQSKFDRLFSYAGLVDQLSLKHVAPETAVLASEADISADSNTTIEEEEISGELTDKLAEDISDPKTDVVSEEHETNLDERIINSLHHLANRVKIQLDILRTMVNQSLSYGDEVSNLANELDDGVIKIGINELNKAVLYDFPLKVLELNHLVEIDTILKSNPNPVTDILLILEFLDS